MQRFGDSTGCWSGVVLSLQSGKGGQGPPQHLSGGLCTTHPGDTVTIETGGLEDVAATQPAWKGGTAPKNHGWLVAALPTHPPAPFGTPWNLSCPWVACSVCQLCQGSQILPGSFAAWGTDPKLEGLSCFVKCSSFCLFSSKCFPNIEVSSKCFANI